MDENIFFQSAEKTIKSLIDQKNNKQDNLNEAQTRFNIIDEIVEGVMGWPKDLIKLEEKSEKGFYDYLLIGKDGQSKIIIEAKREEKKFEFKKKLKKISVNRFKSSGKSSNENFYNAIVQAVSYAREKLAPLAMVCNGDQIAIVLSHASKGIPDDYGDALIFYSLEDIKERLEEFINYVSFDALDAVIPKLYKFLQPKASYVSSSNTLKFVIQGYPRSVYYQQREREKEKEITLEIKNVCGNIVYGIAEKAFEQPKYNEFLDYCYVTPEEYHHREDDQIKSGKTFTKQFMQITDIQSEPAIKKNKFNLPLKDNTSVDPIIILGNVGVGKSIFIDYLMYKNKNLLSDFYVARLRFKNKMIFDEKNIKEKAAEEIYEAFKRGNYDCKEDGVLRDTYAKEISELEKNFKGSSQETISTEIGKFLIKKKENIVTLVRDALKKFKNLSNARKMIVFLDDIDQEEPYIQRRIYAFARELMNEWKVHLCLITMTPLAFKITKSEYIQRSLKSIGHSPIYTVTAPPVTTVFQKRLNFVQKLIKTQRLIDYGYYVSLSPDNLNTDTYISTLINALKPGAEVGAITAKLAGDNIREAIKIVHDYVQSPHTQVVKWNPKIRQYEPIKKISPYKFIRSLIKLNKEDFDDDENPYIFNVFSVTENDPKEHFLLLAILTKMMTKTPHENGNYHSASDIIEWAKRYGFNHFQISNDLKRLATSGLIEPIDLGINDENRDMAISYRIRSKGIYHVDLASNVSYVEDMLKVTPIIGNKEEYHFDTNTFNSIISVKNAEKFYQYLMSIFRENGLSADFLPPHILSKLGESIKNSKQYLLKKEELKVSPDIHLGHKSLRNYSKQAVSKPEFKFF